MDYPLKDKLAFFNSLEACRDGDTEQDDLDVQKDTERLRAKKFQPAVNSPSPSLREGPRKTASDPAPQSCLDDDVQIIAVTPLDANAKLAGNPKATSMSFMDETTVPETALQSTNRPLRQTTHPPSKAQKMYLRDGQSPSVLRTKRKRSGLTMVTESHQIFRGLSFYYIPNDDVNPRRKIRITKAMEYGATWTRSLPDATHIIVDESLTYNDIKAELHTDTMVQDKILVNENYTGDCIRRHTLINPTRGVGHSRYKIRGMPQKPERLKESDTMPVSSRDSDVSLQLKLPCYGNPKEDTPQSSGSTNRSDLAPLTYPHQASVHNDDLEECIGEVQTNPDLYEDLQLNHEGVDATGSEEEITLPTKRNSGGSLGLLPKNSNWQEKFNCMTGGTKDARDTNPNAATIDVLIAWMEQRTIDDEKFRVVSLRKAIATLRDQPKKITTAKEAMKLPHIGQSIADRIEEIVTTGHCQQLDHALADPCRKTRALFLGIYGVGKAQADQWVEQGYRTLEDIKSKAKLNENQKVGVDYYDDLNARIPRDEVTALGTCVKRAALALDPTIELIIGGSYRRGSDTSHDVDFIVTKKGTTSTQDLMPFLNELVNRLFRDGFLTATLAAHRDGDTLGGNKWHGCCVLPEAEFPGPKEDYRPTWRRIDFLVVPETEIGAALIYFTGNDLFNRSIRLLAHKKGMRLNQKVLSGPTVSEGRNEKTIFKILGVHWREPHERWC